MTAGKSCDLEDEPGGRSAAKLQRSYARAGGQPGFKSFLTARGAPTRVPRNARIVSKRAAHETTAVHHAYRRSRSRTAGYGVHSECAKGGADRLAIGSATDGNYEHAHVSAGSAGSGLCRSPRLPNDVSQFGRLPRSLTSACRGVSSTEPRCPRGGRFRRCRRSQERDANNTHRLGDTCRCSSPWLDRE